MINLVQKLTFFGDIFLLSKISCNLRTKQVQKQRTKQVQTNKNLFF